MKKDIEREISFHSLISLMRGTRLILCGADGDPDIVLTLEKDDVKEYLEDAVSELENWWEL